MADEFMFPHTGEVSAAFQPWQELVHRFQQIQAETTNNILESADAIDRIMKAYAGTDATSADKLDSLIDTRMGDNPYDNDQPGSTVPPPPVAGQDDPDAVDPLINLSTNT